ncbi:Nucleoside diphosphate kinase [Caloramator mitchellensis]|uniref:Nucleoside diphosphate kinase n=1 Tax=Caloramator mitchellensis TaxID=908809 RepID=A0A0R3JR13_CALMK|nr:nucleoside-diphosphate kinase [Caloramator mitchellensis]KRQ85895.1 Nucleoside diphosphate kinase [Caloramator mitchellensis]
MERTLVLIKPDGVRRNLIGDIIKRYEMKGLRVASIKSVYPTAEMAKEHYKEHIGKDFFEKLIRFLTSGMVIAIILEGQNAVKCARIINGSTKYQDALPGSIRGDYAFDETENIVHASDSTESAEREIKIWFPEIC